MSVADEGCCPEIACYTAPTCLTFVPPYVRLRPPSTRTVSVYSSYLLQHFVPDCIDTTFIGDGSGEAATACDLDSTLV